MFRTKNVDFSQGKVWKIIVSQAIPLTVAQLVHLAYNIVDRIYLGHLGDGTSIALTGVGLTFPIITLIAAFTALFGTGGVPLFSIARGAGRDDEASKILGNSFFLLLSGSLVLAVLCYTLKKPILYLLGASDVSFEYAVQYLNIYLVGTAFSMLTTGLNGYINAQGFPVIGMLTILLGAVTNIILDPILIFAFDMGVSGAALATVISQAVSAIWVLTFILKKAPVKIKRENVYPDSVVIKGIIKLGVTNFIMQGTNCLVQGICNSTLQTFGGDIYVGIMTVVNSVREILSLPVNGIFSGSMPVISYNYGAKDYKRAVSGINFNTVTGMIYTSIAWIMILIVPGFWFKIFSDDPLSAEYGISCMRIYFFGFVFMSFQFAGQTTFQSLGDAGHAIFFSLLRKAFIVVPLTIVLPRTFSLGVKGVFLAEPISNIIGGLACYITMRMTDYKKLKG